MPKYDVHVHAMVRMRVPGVVAETPTDAAKAAGKTNLSHMLRSGECALLFFTEFMVDRVGKDDVLVETHSLDGKFRLFQRQD